MLRLALLTSDGREIRRDYKKESPDFGTAVVALLQGFAGLPGLEVHVVSCAQQPMQSPEKLGENIWFHSLTVPKIGWMRTAYQGCIRAVRRKLGDIRPDVVHGQGTERDCAISAVFSGFPNVLTIHGNMKLISRVNNARPFSYEWVAARLESFTIPRSDGVVCITHYTRKAVAPTARRTWIVPNAVDAGFFEVRRVSSIPPSILCVGHVSYRKNQNAFIRALDPLRKELEFTALFLGGHGKNDPYSEEFFKALGQRPWCRYEGFADREKLKEYFAAATMLALPSLEDNCPMAVLEAMAAEVPVMAARVGGVPDLIDDGITGLFCDPLDAMSMSNAVKRLVGQVEAGKTLAGKARQHALEHFHPSVVARRHMEIYQEVLSKRS